MAAKNPCGRTRAVNQPYEIWQSEDGLCEWRVLKKYQIDDDKDDARWDCAYKSPDTWNDWEYCGLFVQDIKSRAYRFYVDPILPSFFDNLRPEPHGTLINVPDHNQNLTILYAENFPDLTNYFKEDAMSYHVSDALGRALFFFKVKPEECTNILESEWGFSYEREEQHALKTHLLVYDRLDDLLRVPFFYNLKDPHHVHEALQLVEQGLLFFYLLTLQNDKLGFVERRSIYLSEDLKQELATVIKTILLEVKIAT